MLERGGDGWFATSGDGGPHLVPLSFAWDAQAGQIILCTSANTPTARNIAQGSPVHVALGHTRDVVMMRGRATTVGPVGDDDATRELFAARAGWDPVGDAGDLVFLRVTPLRIQAWREVDEFPGRTVMKRGHWLR
jgi:general stress protein 26